MRSRSPAGASEESEKSARVAGLRTHPGPRLPYLPGLDGLRALAVTAVLLYHAAGNWLPGGFLGVEVFFVISGYLITSLLLAEWSQDGGIDLKAFWLRRARRLLPAAFSLILLTLAYAAVFLPEEVARMRADSLASFVYLTNWYLVVDQQSYFEIVGRPSPLRHLWSLAVEEQFYLLWPVLFVIGMGRGGRQFLLGAVLLGVALSTLLMGLLYVPDADPSRVYYGTDTRAAGLLVGVALAFVWLPGRSQGRLDKLPFDLLGFLALGLLAASAARLDEFQAFLYQGGFALVALQTAVVIAAVVHPRARLLTACLGWAPLRWLGTRSYSLYLWHWPIFSVTRPQLDLPLDGLPVLGLRFGITLLLAELSYRLVETPLRTGALTRSWTAYRQTRGRRHLWLGLRWATSASTVLALTVSLGVSVANAQPPSLPAYLAVAAINTIERTPVSDSGVAGAGDEAPAEPASVDPTRVTLTGGSPTPPETPAVEPTATPAAGAAPAERRATSASVLPSTRTPGPTTATPSSTPTRVPPTVTVAPAASPVPVNPAPAASRFGCVTAIGDSVMLGANSELVRELGRVEMDAAVGRQVSAALEVARALAAAGRLSDIVVIHLGNNGTFSARQFEELMQVLGEARQVVFFTVRVPRQWEGSVNETLLNNAQRYANVRVVDWHAIGGSQPELFWEDGIHLRPEGAQLYASLAAAAIAGQ